MARDFLILDMMSDVSKSVAAETVEKISIFDIEFHEENFYRICDIEELMDSIIQEGGVQENIVVRRNPNGSEYKYQLISGHRRVTASLRLVKEGYSEFEFIHARVKNNMSDEDALYELIKANSTQRVRSEYEIVTEYLLLKKLAANKKANNEFKGKTRTFIAEFMGVSEAQVAIYNTIGTRLHSDLMELFAKEEIKISLAYEIAKLADDDQLALVDVYLEKGRLTSEDVKELISKKALPGQTTIKMLEEKQKVSDSDTLEQTAAEEKVLDSDTFKTHHTTEKLAAYYTNNTDDIVTALDFIFQMNANEDIFEELLEVFRSKEVNPEIVAEMVFKKILPYEDDCIRVFVNGGYQIEYKHTLEAHIIPYYPFWKGFKDYFHNQIKDIQKVPETSTFEKEEDVQRTDTVEPEEKVLETSTFENSNMAAEQLYSIEDVKKELNTHKQWYEQSKREGVVNFAIKEKMLYDALTLLIDSIKRGNQDENYGL